MHHAKDILKLLAFTGTPVVLCGLISWILPGEGIVGMFVAGGVAAVCTTYLLAGKLRREGNDISGGLQMLEKNLSDGLQTLTLPKSRRDLFPGTKSSFDKLAATLSHRIQTLLASNEDLSRSYSRFQSILATMREGVLLITGEGRVLYCNRSAGKLLGRQSSQVEGRLLWEVVRAPNLETAIEVAFNSGEELRQELELVRTNSLVELSAVQLDVYSGAGMVVVLHDVSELRRLERMRREFVSNVSHELKTPLTAIQAYADTLLDGGLEDTENSRRFVERIQEQSDRLQQMIQDMLRLARIESQADAFQLQPVSLTETVESCVDARFAVARARNIALEYRCDEDAEICIVADQEGLRTIFDNLINNALNYTQQNGTVEVRCRREGTNALIEVTDNGIGIPAEHHDRIFERFYRVDQARSRGMGGTGLGLAIVKHCVGVFGGRIEIDSEVGRGTKFRVFFPLVEESLKVAQHA